jgi:hypothetical protein
MFHAEECVKSLQYGLGLPCVIQGQFAFSDSKQIILLAFIIAWNRSDDPGGRIGIV